MRLLHRDVGFDLSGKRAGYLQIEISVFSYLFTLYRFFDKFSLNVIILVNENDTADSTITLGACLVISLN